MATASPSANQVSDAETWQEYLAGHLGETAGVLFDPSRAMAKMRRSGNRYDQEIVDYLVNQQFDYFDMNEVHLRDFKKCNLPYQNYRRQSEAVIPPKAA